MANEIWTIKRCLEWTKEYLAERGEEHPVFLPSGCSALPRV